MWAWRWTQRSLLPTAGPLGPLSHSTRRLAAGPQPPSPPPLRHPNNTGQRGSAQNRTAKCCGARRNAQPQFHKKTGHAAHNPRNFFFGRVHLPTFSFLLQHYQKYRNSGRPRTNRVQNAYIAPPAFWSLVLGQVCRLALCSAQARAISRIADVAVSTKSKTVRSTPPERRCAPRRSKRCTDIVRPTTANSPLAINSGQVSSETST